jgi:tetratricopeptide (TPR) repeat protein
MSLRDEEVWRWRESSADPRALSARAADLADAVRDVSPLAPEALARVKAGVLARRPTRAGRGLPLGLRFALLTGVVLASVATARGTMTLWRRYVAAPAKDEVAAPRKIAVARPAPRPVIVEVAPEPSEDVAAAAPPPAVPAVAALAPRPRRTSVARAIERDEPPAEAPSTATEETQLLARAISRLRQARDPRGAIAMLDQYDRAFPRGVMQPEALRARLEAVIQMDDRQTALALLDGRAAAALSGRLGSELLLTRAELRASAGRYADALADFDRLLAPSSPTLTAELAGRALYGRAISLAHLGRDGGARANLAAYERRFPDGKFASEVARLLQNPKQQPKAQDRP